MRADRRARAAPASARGEAQPLPCRAELIGKEADPPAREGRSPAAASPPDATPPPGNRRGGGPPLLRTLPPRPGPEARSSSGPRRSSRRGERRPAVRSGRADRRDPMGTSDYRRNHLPGPPLRWRGGILSGGERGDRRSKVRRVRFATIIPVFNERLSLPLVVGDLRGPLHRGDRRRRQRLLRRNGLARPPHFRFAWSPSARRGVRQCVSRRNRRALAAAPPDGVSSWTATIPIIPRKRDCCSDAIRSGRGPGHRFPACSDGPEPRRASSPGARRERARDATSCVGSTGNNTRIWGPSGPSAGTRSRRSGWKTRTSAGRAKCRSRRRASG